MQENQETRDEAANGPEPAPAIFLPSVLLPADISFGRLRAELEGEVRPVLKELEVYSDVETPPPGYRLETEIEAIDEAAGEAGFESFHLVGFSEGGGIALAYAARYPDSLLSLVLIEPAWTGNQGWTPEEEEYWTEMHRVMALQSERRMEAFLAFKVGTSGLAPAPSGPPPAWMASRPAGLAALVKAFRRYNLAPKRFRRFRRPVYVALGELSHPVERARVDRLAALFPHLHLEVFPGRSHLDPPHWAEPERFAQSLRDLWRGPHVGGGG
jgi:pimeloyl-ACP methyl ester carboxylesterase